jgi:hypothetical protein
MGENLKKNIGKKSFLSLNRSHVYNLNVNEQAIGLAAEFY